MSEPPPPPRRWSQLDDCERCGEVTIHEFTELERTTRGALRLPGDPAGQVRVLSFSCLNCAVRRAAARSA